MESKEIKWQYLDIVKGVAIFLMLWGHCIQYCTNGEFDFSQNLVFRTIYTFHMPLFMIVSGYLFYFSCKKRNFVALVSHRTQLLLQPIIMCELMLCLTTTVIAEKSFFSIISAQWLRHLNSFWFLWSVLSASIAVAVAAKIKHRFLRAIAVILGFGFVCMFPNWENNLIMYPYFLAGFFFAKYKPYLPKIVIELKYVALALFPILLAVYLKGKYTFGNIIILDENIKRNIALNVWQVVLGVVGAGFALVVLEIVYNVFFAKRKTLAKPVVMLGEKSLQIYCVSVSVLSYWLPVLFSKLCEIIGRNIFVSHMWLYNFVFTPLLAVAYAILIYYIVKAMEKLKISNLVFGR